MTVVIDCGCGFYPDHPNDESVETLIGMYAPELLFGLDPALPKQTINSRGPTWVVLLPVAAWTRDGTVGFTRNANGLVQETIDDPALEQVRCIDLAEAITGFAAERDDVVLKLDVEGAEYTLLEHLIQTGTDRLLSTALVEWHGGGIDTTRELIDRLACPVTSW